MARSRLIVAGTFWLLSAYSQAAQAPLSWNDCLKMAADQNPELVSSLRSVESERAQYHGSYNGLLPRVNLNSSYNRSKDDSRASRWNAGASANMDLFSQSRYAGIQSASADLARAEAAHRQTSADIRFSLRRAFAQLLFAQTQVDVAQTIMNIRERNTSLVSLRYDSGRESKGNRLRARAELLQAKSNLSQAQRDLRAAQQEMNRQLGRDQFESLVVSGGMGPAGTPPERPENWDDTASHHPAVQSVEAGLKTAKAGVRDAESDLWPALSASYSRSFTGDSYFPDRPDWSAAGVVSYPIFGGGPTAAYHSVKAARRNVEAAEADVRARELQVTSDLENSWADDASARDQVEVQTAFLDAARQRNAEADVRYSNGLLSYENWEQIVTDRVNFEQSLIRTKRDAMIAEAQWENALGKGLEQ